MINTDDKLKFIFQDEAFNNITEELIMKFGFKKDEFINMSLKELEHHTNGTWNAEEMKLGLEHLVSNSIKESPILEIEDFKVIALVPNNATDFIIIAPGGGYQEIATIVEGLPVARALNQKNIAVFIFIYGTNEDALFPKPLSQLGSLINYINKSEKYSRLNINNYALMGFSAGGHLISNFALENICKDKYNCPAPKCIILGYSVISMFENAHIRSRSMVLGDMQNDINLQKKYSADLMLDANYPKTYIWTLENDKAVNSLNSINLAKALKRNNVEHKLVLYPGTVHGLGLSTGRMADSWLDDALEFWLT